MRFISIIIPCYNAEKYIKECFESVKKQTIGIDNLEVIFINDASTDKTGELLQQFKEEYPDSVHVETLSENRKQGGARNVGLSVASGKYIVFLDADDWVDITLYQKLYDIAEKYDLEMIQYPMIKYDHGIMRVEDPAEIKGLIILEDDEMQKLFLTGQALTCGSQTKLYKRSFIEKIGARFIEGRAYEEPSFVYPLLLSVKRVYCTEEPLYYYRMHEKSTMHQYVRQPGKLLDHAVVQLSIFKNLKEQTEIWIRFHDEIIYYFILSYFIETLYFVGSCDLALSLTEFENLKNTIFAEVPEYKENKYLQSLTGNFKKALEMLNRQISQTELNYFCRRIMTERDN